MENDTQVTEQPTGLFDYIAGQQFVAEEADGTVNLEEASPPTESVSAESSENAPEAASGSEEAAGVTPGQDSISRDDFLRIQQENEALRRSHSTSLSALALVAQEAKKREDMLFEQNIADLSEEEQQMARDRRDVERIRAENEVLRNQNRIRETREAQVQENIDKSTFAQLVASQLGLPAETSVLSLLLETSSPAEMVDRANRMSQFYKATAVQQAQQTAVQAAKSGVHAAGGETAPASAPPKVPQRSGNLIDMMRERNYTTEEIR